ncbi:MAG TPA: DUF2269 family protein [Frankiaceae bacterium]|nr:DUF2269 family protein [Frankiaceae bacterium]
MLNLRNVLLTAHILAAIVTVGWLALQSMVVPGLIRRGPENAGYVRGSASVARKAGPLSGLVFVLGLWLVLRDGDDALDFSEPWISASMLIFIVTAVLGGAVGGKAEQRAADKLAAGQTALDEARTLSIVGAVDMLLLVVIVWLMVAKPS